MELPEPSGRTTVEERRPRLIRRLVVALLKLGVGSLLRELINREFGKSLSLESVRRVMKLLGFSAQKPLYQAWQQDPARVQQWEDETYPAIKAQAKASGANIYFADEAGIRSDYHTGTTWAPVGETPVVAVTGRRFSFNMISAVSPRGDFRFMIHEGTVDAAVWTCQKFCVRGQNS